ncbi:MAG: dihydropteroate synthase [Candidatus Hadarchaeales archaeon]
MKNRARLGRIKIGDGLPVAVIGIINLSPESFYQGSVARSIEDALKIGEKMVEEGACILDVGARATGPGAIQISINEERKRLIPTVRKLAGELDVPISVDTQFSKVAEEAVEAGAEIINDISGLKRDRGVAEVAAKYDCSLILMAAKRNPGDTTTIKEIKSAWKESLKICRLSGVRLSNVALDPAIGAWPARLEKLGRKAFKKHRGFAKTDLIDLEIIARLKELKKIGRPICVGISRKSFIGRILGLDDPAERLAGSLGATIMAIINGASAVRTHDPKETSQAIRVCEAILKASS